MAVGKTIRRRIEAIGTDRRHGANWLAQEALRTLGFAASESRAGSVSALLAELREVGAASRSSRPAMAPIRYWVDRFERDLAGSLRAGAGVADVRQLAIDIAELLVETAGDMQRQAARRAAEWIADGTTVLTCSSSATVAESLRIASQLARRGRLIALASVGESGVSHGELMASRLESTGIVVDVVPDSSVDAACARADLILIGADTVLSDGSVVNGTPSLAVAEAAARARKPLYVVAETAKVDPTRSAALVEIEPGFDLVPARLIRTVIAETSAP